MAKEGIVLYIGGFELPDKNAAAQRVIGIAKGLREIGFEVEFLNSLKNRDGDKGTAIKDYFGFKCYEYNRETEYDYLFTGATCLSMIERIKPQVVIAYNYPAFSLNKIRKYCASNGIKCYADATEWYLAKNKNPVFRIIKTMDTSYRMKSVHKKLDGVIAISRYLYDYYADSVKTVMIPPTVDITDEKWNVEAVRDNDGISFVYAGSPSAQKERLDLIVQAIENLKENNVKLNIIGITEEDYNRMYGNQISMKDRIEFFGKVEHTKALEIVKKSDWSVIIRDNNLVVKAGFPTKLVESISCGTPVIANDFSNITDYIDSCNGIICQDKNNISCDLLSACKKKMTVDNALFDYRFYIEELRGLI